MTVCDFPLDRKPGIIGRMMRSYLVTKRYFGMMLIAVSGLLVTGVLVYDLLKHHTIGERFQLLAFVGAAMIGLLGVLLLPLGDNPL